MLDHPGFGISRDQTCNWGLEWDTCAPGLLCGVASNVAGHSAKIFPPKSLTHSNDAEMEFQSRRAYPRKTRKNGAPDRIRMCDLCLRRGIRHCCALCAAPTAASNRARASRNRKASEPKFTASHPKAGQVLLQCLGQRREPLLLLPWHWQHMTIFDHIGQRRRRRHRPVLGSGPALDAGATRMANSDQVVNQQVASRR